MNKKLVFVVCGAGTLTSLIASQGIDEGIKKRGIKNIEVRNGRLDDIERLSDQIVILVSTMNIRQKFEFPVLNAISFLTGDENGQNEIIDKIVSYLTIL